MSNRYSVRDVSVREFLLARTLLISILVLVFAASGFAKMYERPKSFALQGQSQQQLERKTLPRINFDALKAEDRARRAKRERPGPFRFAVAADVVYTLDHSGTWQTLADGRLWRLSIQSPGAKNMSLGISRFEMPEGAKLWIYDPGQKHVEGPYTSRHRSRLGSLWTPVIGGDEIVVEVFVPAGAAQPVIEIRKVNQGYRGLAGVLGMSEGTCEIDAVCPEGDPWRDQIRAVNVYTISGTGACTGNLMNNTALDGRPFVLSANHCGVTGGTDASIVTYWNFQSATCGTHGPGSTADSQTGATLRANWASSDFVLFELSHFSATQPIDPAFNVFYAGWDRTDTAPAGTVTIHHPSSDVKALAFSNTSPTKTAYLSDTTAPAGNHWRTIMSSGVLEHGSSGSCLFETTSGRCIGQLHGGDHDCPQAADHDWYGRFGVSWTGNGTDSTRLSNWLDPVPTGASTLHGDPHITTVNGIHFDFQGAGEYVALRNASGLEIQVRQAPIATTFSPGTDPHDGLATCVSLNTAVAARVGRHRVTYEPNLNGVPDPSGLQLRIDGVLTTLGPAGQDLGDGGRIVKTSVPGGLEIDFPDSNVLLVTPGWWSSQSKWYLNVDVVRRPAMDGMGGGMLAAASRSAVASRSSTGGLMGAVPEGSWLPLLPDGTSVGPMPAATHQRYVDLYQKFGGAWRVSDRTSLFDYAPGTSTSTFTMSSWPSEHPPCTVPGAKAVDPVPLAVAERACRQVTGKNRHADCVFDVRVTGHTGFAETYLATEQAEASIGSPVVPTRRTTKLAVFLDLGAGIPQGTFSNAFDPGLSINAGLEYLIRPRVSAEAIVGLHHFPNKDAGNLEIYQLSVNAKVYSTPPPATVRPFINGGVGTYKLSPGSSHTGANVGVGVLWERTPRFGLQASYNFHTVSTSGAATRFSTLQGGIRVVF